MNSIQQGPFVFTHDPSREGAEVWAISFANGGKMPTYFVVKNYGGKPAAGFAGWKLVSGGPFDSAGAYATLDEAIAGVVPFLISYVREDAARKIAEAMALADSLALALDAVSPPSTDDRNARERLAAAAEWLRYQDENLSFGLKSAADGLKLWAHWQAHPDFPEFSDEDTEDFDCYAERVKVLGYDPITRAYELLTQ